MLASIFATLLLGGAVLLAFWADFRLGGGPARVVAVTCHLAAAALALVLSAEAMRAVDGSGSRPLAVLSVMVVFLPALVYLFTSALWMLRLIQRSVAHERSSPRREAGGSRASRRRAALASPPGAPAAPSHRPAPA